MRNDVQNPIVDKTFKFAVDIIKFCEVLNKDGRGVISKQIIRCGTSIGANVREAQNAESKADFIHKMKIACKEADESEYFILLCKACWNYNECENLLKQLEEIIKILSKIVSSSKSK